MADTYIYDAECGWGGAYPEDGECPTCGAGVSLLQLEIYTNYEGEEDDDGAE